ARSRDVLLGGALAAGYRKLEREHRAAGGCRVHLERTTVRLHDRACDEEPEAGPGLRAPRHGRTTELLEDQFLIVHGNARSLIANAHPHDAVVRARAHTDLGAGRRVLDRIVHEVLDDLTQALAVTAEMRQRSVHLCADSYLVLTELGGR